MKVGFLHDDPGYVGGAELTMREFKTAAPQGVEILDCPPGQIEDCDRYVIGNAQTYKERPSGIRYLHDMRGGFTSEDTLIFCSPLQQSHYDNVDGHVIPPALDLQRFKPTRQVRRNGTRKGTVSIGQWRNPGKGQQQLREWSANALLTVYGGGDFIPIGPNIDYMGELRAELVPRALWEAERFVHLPTAIEPFGRAVAEAYIAGCEVITNNLVGAKHYIENDPDALESAAERFWEVVCG